MARRPTKAARPISTAPKRSARSGWFFVFRSSAMGALRFPRRAMPFGPHTDTGQGPEHQTDRSVMEREVRESDEEDRDHRDEREAVEDRERRLVLSASHPPEHGEEAPSDRSAEGREPHDPR